MPGPAAETVSDPSVTASDSVVGTGEAAAELVAGQLVLDSALLGFLALALALPVYALLRVLGRAPRQFGKVDPQPLGAPDLLVACGMVALLLVMMTGGTNRAAPAEDVAITQESIAVVSEAGTEDEVENPEEPATARAAGQPAQQADAPRATGIGLWFSALFWGTICMAVVLFLGGIRGIALVPWLGLTRHGLIKAFGIGFVALLLSLPIVILANAAFQHLVLKPHFPDLGVQEAVRIFMTSSDIGVRVALVVSAVIVAPVAEELLFRGFLYPAIKRFTDPLFAMVCSGLLFAAVHNNLPALVPLMILGIAFALAYEYSGNLWVPVFMHALFNLFNITIMLVMGPLADLPEGGYRESPPLVVRESVSEHAPAEPAVDPR